MSKSRKSKSVKDNKFFTTSLSKQSICNLQNNSKEAKLHVTQDEPKARRVIGLSRKRQEIEKAKFI